MSHDRHFLNKVCTHIADVDYGDIKIYPGNYAFWKQSTELARKQLEDKNKKDDAKVKELEDFVDASVRMRQSLSKPHRVKS